MPNTTNFVSSDLKRCISSNLKRLDIPNLRPNPKGTVSCLTKKKHHNHPRFDPKHANLDLKLTLKLNACEIHSVGSVTLTSG